MCPCGSAMSADGPTPGSPATASCAASRRDRGCRSARGHSPATARSRSIWRTTARRSSPSSAPPEHALLAAAVAEAGAIDATDVVMRITSAVPPGSSSARRPRSAWASSPPSMRSEARRARPTSWRPPPTGPRQGGSVARPASRTRWRLPRWRQPHRSSTTHGWRDAPSPWPQVTGRPSTSASCTSPMEHPHDSSAIHDEVIAALDAAGPSTPRLEALRVLAAEAGEALRTRRPRPVRASAHGGDRGPDGPPPGARVRRRAGLIEGSNRGGAGLEGQRRRRRGRLAQRPLPRPERPRAGRLRARRLGHQPLDLPTSASRGLRRGSATGEGGRPPLEEGSHALGVVLGGEALLERSPGAQEVRRSLPAIAS